MQSYESDVQTLSSIRVAPYFALYKGEDDVYCYFDINFSILQSSIIKLSLSRVEIKAYNTNVTQDSEGKRKNTYTEEASKSVASQNDINKMLLKSYNFAKFAKQKLASMIASNYIGNLESYVVQNAKSEIKNGKNPKDIPSLYSSIDVIEPLGNFEIKSLSFFNSLHTREDIKRLNLDALTKKLIDPAEIVQPSMSTSTVDIVKKIRNFYLAQKPSDTSDEVYYKKVKKPSLTDRINFPIPLKIPKKFCNAVLDINFEVYNSISSVPIETIKQNLDVESLKRYYTLIKKEPKLGYVIDNKLTLLQEDSKANAIQTFVKEVNGVGIISRYSLHNDTEVNTGNTKIINCLKAKGKISIYRSIPYEAPSAKKSSIFASVVVGDPIDLDQTGLVITDKPDTSTGVEIKVYNIPTDVSQLKIVRKQVVNNVVREDTKLEVVQFNYTPEVNHNVVVVEDNLVANNEVYEYTVFYKTKTGELRKSVTQLYKYVNSSILTSVATIISSPTLENIDGEPSFRFNLSSQIKQREADKIKEYIKNSDLYEEFQSEIGKINDTFNNLIVHRVTRVNLKTGQREIFDDIPVDGTFIDDSQSRKKFSVSTLEPLTSYHYEVRVSLRDPITLLRDYVKTVTVPIGKGTKTYSYRPYRWRQPKTLRTGTLLAQDNDGNIISTQTMFEDGEIGVTATYTLPSIARAATVVSLNAERIDVNKIKITWDVEGDENEYDHFVVVKDVNGKKKLWMSSHIKEVIDIVDINNDAGTVAYQVTPVFMDYTVGAPNKTNSILIDPSEYYSTYYVVT